MTVAPPHTQRRRLLGTSRFGIADQWLPLLAGFITTAIIMGTGALTLTALGIGLFAYSFIWYIDTLGKEIAIVPVVALIASAQWLVGPYFAYTFGAVTYKYFMYVDEATYFSFVFPAVLAFIIGMQLVAPKITIASLQNHIKTHAALRPRTVYYFYASGILAGLLSPYVPGPLRFPFFLLSQFTFIAIIYFLVLRLNGRWLALVFAFVSILINSANDGLFHLVLLWSALIISYVCAELRVGFFVKLIGIVLAVLLIAQLQAAKAQYRLIILLDPSQAGISTLISTMQNVAVFNPSQEQRAAINYGQLNARLNQGWIISAVMSYVPDYLPFEGGNTIVLAMRDSIAPRLLVNKRQAKVSDYFEKYTGLSVSSNTSFGISVLGEAWINFGQFGILFMGVFGAFYGGVLRWAAHISKTYPTIILWMPLLFLQAIKAETELLVVLNHIIKSGVFIWAIYYVSYKYLRIRI